VQADSLPMTIQLLRRTKEKIYTSQPHLFTETYNLKNMDKGPAGKLQHLFPINKKSY